MADFFIEFGEWIQIAGNEISNLGTLIMPYSFFAYLPFRFLIFSWKKGLRYNNLVKSIWYLAYGTMLLTNDVGVDLVVMLIAFIEGIDLFFKYLEERRESKKASY